MTYSELRTRTLQRLGDPVDGSQGFYSPNEAGVALNSIQNLFAFLTLCLEVEATFALSTDGRPFYHLQQTFSDFVVPLRVSINGGVRLKPSRLSDLAARESRWSVTPGVPSRYSFNGLDLLGVFRQPTVATSLALVYARMPAPMTADSDTPDIPAEYHMNLIDGAIPLLRTKEGAQEWQKDLPLWDRFMDAVTKMADYVRARHKEQAYDPIPIEIRRFDMSTIKQGNR